MEVLGLPEERILAQGQRKHEFFDPSTNEPYLTRDSQNNLRIPGSKPLEEALLCESDSFIDFVKRCLEWDPEKRITPYEALMHQWIIEGLPHQVLIHHKNMLGIHDSENDMGTNNDLSMVDDIGGEEFQVETQQDSTQFTNNDISETD